jgi:hypothetical protein
MVVLIVSMKYGVFKMKFESKMHMVQELITGKRFKTNSCVEIYYDEKYPNPFRHGSGEMHDMWNAYCKDIWIEIECEERHVHQDLIDSYQEGQAWQYRNDSDADWVDLSTRFVYRRPAWKEYTQYRLHPHNELIQAHRNGAEIQVYSHGEWVDIELEPCWHEGSQYRVKPATNIVYEWVAKSKFTHRWEIITLLLSEEEAKEYFYGREYRKTGRSLEVDHE